MIDAAAGSPEIIVVASAAGIVSAGFAIAGFWMALGSRLSRAEAAATNALQTSAEIDNDLKQRISANEKETHDESERLSLLNSQFALYREQAIEKFVTHQAITELEKRLIEMQSKSEQRLVDSLEGLNKRLDQLIQAALNKLS